MVPLAQVAESGRGGLPAVVADRNLWGQVKLAKLCAKTGARLVHAAEVEVRWGAERGWVVVLCRSAAGWRALRRLCSASTPPSCDIAGLAAASAEAAGGLVVLTGGCAENGGLLHSALRSGGAAGASAALAALREAVGEECLRVELAPTMGGDWRALADLGESALKSARA
jgi:DNA polymerase III alpha subunit